MLVTGADGFVGKAVCRRLLKTGYAPRAGLLSGALWPALHEATPGLSEFAVLGDLGANPNFNGAFENVAVVVHLAARVHIMHDDAVDPREAYRQVNVDGTVALARAAAEQGVRRMVFVSTVKVNGESTSGRPFMEGDPPDPQDSYAVSKWEAEEALRSVAANTGLEIAIVRPPLAYGPGVRANFLRLMRLVERGVPLPLPDTKNRRSLIGVENLADFLVRCVSHPEAANETFMVSDGEDVSTRELIARLARALGRSARFLPVPEFAVRFAARLVGKEAAVNRLLGSLAVNSDKARQRLGWKPPVTLDSGLAATARWYLESSRRLA
ncbi:MAG: SDR family oxidoreductase [Bryobacterales bacterium]|nr:SDR family oxidoreductase [Bryobacterales bacterium]